MITTGSVRGKWCIPHFGHSRRQPAAPTTVVVPQFEQKRRRACQASNDLAVASMLASGAGTRPPAASDRRSTILRSSRPGTMSTRWSRNPSLASACSTTASSGSSAANTGAPSGRSPSSASTARAAKRLDLGRAAAADRARRRPFAGPACRARSRRTRASGRVRNAATAAGSSRNAEARSSGSAA